MRRVLLAPVVFAPQAAAHDVDLTRLPPGNGKITTEPKTGFIRACRDDPNGSGAFRNAGAHETPRGAFLGRP
ncbi:MAG: hypothetical protein ISR49_21450 [Alphaproteobacteria bacterium]|nr:hypothetical protein [Alphaproteobacteria bacterium]